MKCPRCQQDAPPGMRVCPACGDPLRHRSASASARGTALEATLTAIAKTAARLCEARDAQIFLVEGENLRLVGQHGSLRTAQRPGEPFPLSNRTVSTHAMREQRVIHVRDLKAVVRTQYPDLVAHQRGVGVRTILAAPLISKGAAIGVILIRRLKVRPFTAKQIALLKTFADQAAIAIENTRLFTELQQKNQALTAAHAQVTEALDQQTATSEILRVIASSPTELRPVFESLVASAARLCGANDLLLLIREGDVLRPTAGVGAFWDSLAAEFRVPLVRGTVAARSVIDGATLHFPDLAVLPEAEFPVGRELQRRFGHHTVLAVPLLREGTALGTIFALRFEVQAFTEQQIQLLKTFADQGVIAIENVRLFRELEARNRDLTEALEQQTATAEILKVISTSPTNLQPVLDTVVASAARFCGAYDVTLFQVDGDTLRFPAHYGPIPVPEEGSIPLMRGHVTGRAVLERRVVHLADVQAEAPEFPEGAAHAQRHGHRTIVAAPLLREGAAIGALLLRRREVNPFSDKQIALLQTFADQAVIAIENVRLFKELQTSNRDLTAALEQQTATSEILRAITHAPTDTQPVFDTIVRSAATLCHAAVTAVFLTDGQMVFVPANYGSSPEALGAVRARFPRPLDMESSGGIAILTRSVVHVPDSEEPSVGELVRQHGRRLGYRSLITVPMLRDGAAVGAIGVYRREPGRFSDAEVALLQTFADQAVIAIENVRLFNETKEALERQTATSEILGVIASSPTDVEPVFRTIIESAVRLCGASLGAMYHYDGQLIRFGAHHGYTPAVLELVHRVFPAQADQTTLVGRAILNCQVVSVPDYDTEADIPDLLRRFLEVVGSRSSLAAPMLRQGEPIGAIAVWRGESGPFADKQIALLETFADQAVIAIENVRLFAELEARNRDLTATSEILQVISRSPTDVQPVFDTIAERAMRLCSAALGAVFMFDGALIHLSALANVRPEGVEALRKAYPRAPSQGSNTGRVILIGGVVEIPDVLADPEYQLTGPAAAADFRSTLGVPMLHQARAIGVIVVSRPEPGTFSEEQIQLLKTFADQAVIAIENVRLFKELQARTAELTRSVGELTALGEVGRAVSSTLDLQTVLDTIVARAAQLSGTHGGVIYEYDEATQTFHLRAAHRLEDELVEALRREPLRLGEGATGQAVATRAPFQVTNLLDEKEYSLTRVRAILARLGYRSILAVPLIFEERILGALVVHRQETGAFAPEVVTLLQTFAAQSALAIQNARLFREIEDKGRQLEAASRHKSEFLANMSHELRTPLNAITGFSEVLLERMFGEINPKQTEYLQDILSSGRHLLSLINDILDLSKIEAGRMELTTASFHLPVAIDNALTLVKERAARHGIGLDISVDPALGEFVGDERKIKQVLLNLLSNAVKFTPEGGRIGVKAGLADGAVEIAVSDTGIGIAPKDQEAIFEEFRQVGSDEARKVEGTGLGLTLTKKFIEMHGGRIWVESEVGKGSTFRFTLPVGPWPTSSS